MSNAGAALGVSLVLDPMIFLLAAALYAIHDRLRFEGRITPGGAALDPRLQPAASATVVAAGFVHPHPLRARDGELVVERGGADLAGPLFPDLHHLEPDLLLDEGGARAADARASAPSEAEATALRIELQRLRLQLDPHFLFNALTGIGEEIPDHPEAALAMLRDLSTFLRQSLSGMDVTIATVGEEAEALASYLRVQQARFGSRLHAGSTIDAGRRRPAHPKLPAAAAGGERDRLWPPRTAARTGRRDPRRGRHAAATVTNSGSWRRRRTREPQRDRPRQCPPPAGPALSRPPRLRPVAAGRGRWSRASRCKVSRDPCRDRR